MKDLKNKVAAITGAASGIRRAPAVNLGKEGCHLALSDINSNGLEETRQMAAGNKVNVSSHLIDVAARSQVYGHAADAVKLHGRVDIVNISSINGMIPFPHNGPYNSAKFALRGFNKTLMQELRGSSIHVTSVHPGGVKTNIARNMRFYKHIDQNVSHTELIDGFDKLTQTTAEDAARIIITGIKKIKSA